MQFNVAAKTGLLGGCLLNSGWAYLDDPMVLIDRNGLVLRAHLQAGVNVVSEHNLSWNYADTFAPSSGYDPNATWLEGYVKPGLSFTQSLGGVALYGKANPFGQATRVVEANGVPNPIAGVTASHLADDVFLEYNRVLNANTYLTAGFSVSFPGPGANSVVDGDASVWTGGFANVVVNF